VSAEYLPVSWHYHPANGLGLPLVGRLLPSVLRRVLGTLPIVVAVGRRLAARPLASLDPARALGKYVDPHATRDDCPSAPLHPSRLLDFAA
jgi:hypothetical protein